MAHPEQSEPNDTDFPDETRAHNVAWEALGAEEAEIVRAGRQRSESTGVTMLNPAVAFMHGLAFAIDARKMLALASTGLTESDLQVLESSGDVPPID